MEPDWHFGQTILHLSEVELKHITKEVAKLDESPM